MFRTPVRNQHGKCITENDLDLTFSSEHTPVYESPSGVLIISANDRPLAISEERPEPVKTPMRPSSEICLLAEIEFLKNDIENEREKNEDLGRMLKEKEAAISELTKQLAEQKAESRANKQKLERNSIENMLEKNKLIAEVECFSRENAELLARLNEYKFVEKQVNIAKEEMRVKYLKKLATVKAVLKERYEADRQKALEFYREKLRLSEELEALTTKFTMVIEKIPALRGLLKSSSTSSLKVLNSNKEEPLLRPMEFENIDLQLKSSKPPAAGKENLEIL